MEMHIIKDGDDMQIPVLPESIEISGSRSDEKVTVHTAGEVNLIGLKGLKSVDFSSIFPHTDSGYSFLDAPASSDPYDYTKKLEAYFDDGDVIEFLVTDLGIKWDATVSDFKYGRNDGTGDVEYSITIEQYNIVSGRVTSNKKTVKYTVKSGDTLAKIAYKYLGATKYKTQIYNDNKSAIEKAFKKHQKALKKAGKAQVKSKTSKKGKYLYKGTKLTIKQAVT